jgi:hypothetical protein
MTSKSKNLRKNSPFCTPLMSRNYKNTQKTWNHSSLMKSLTWETNSPINPAKLNTNSRKKGSSSRGFRPKKTNFLTKSKLWTLGTSFLWRRETLRSSNLMIKSVNWAQCKKK